MKRKLASEARRDVYRMRKAIVEPVFGQIKEWRGFRRFSLRGLDNVRGEWKLVCLTHNLLKLFRSGYVLAPCLGRTEDAIAPIKSGSLCMESPTDRLLGVPHYEHLKPMPHRGKPQYRRGYLRQTPRPLSLAEPTSE